MNGRAQDDCMIYVRMSSADIRRAKQEAHGDRERLAELTAGKVAAHLAECRAYARDEGWRVLAEYTDNMVSGSKRYRGASQHLTGREALEADLKDRAGQKIYLLSTEVARLYRDTKESRVLVDIAERTHVIVVSTDGEEYDLKTARGEGRFEGAVSQAAQESAIVSERRRRKERTRAEAGGYWGNNPFGHHKVYDTDPASGQRYYTGQLELCDETCPGRDGCMNTRPADLHDYDDEDYVPAREGTFRPPLAGNPLRELFTWSGEAGLIRAAARWLVGRADEPGHSLHSIVKDWQAYGVTSRNGNRINQPQLRNLLLNKRMNGVRVHRAGDKFGRADRTAKGRETLNAYPKILDDDLFMAVRGVLMNPDRFKHVSKTRDPRKHLLAGHRRLRQHPARRPRMRREDERAPGRPPPR